MTKNTKTQKTITTITSTDTGWTIGRIISYSANDHEAHACNLAGSFLQKFFSSYSNAESWIRTGTYTPPWAK